MPALVAIISLESKYDGMHEQLKELQSTSKKVVNLSGPTYNVGDTVTVLRFEYGKGKHKKIQPGGVGKVCSVSRSEEPSIDDKSDGKIGVRYMYGVKYGDGDGGARKLGEEVLLLHDDGPEDCRQPNSDRSTFAIEQGADIRTVDMEIIAAYSMLDKQLDKIPHGVNSACFKTAQVFHINRPNLLNLMKIHAWQQIRFAAMQRDVALLTKTAAELSDFCVALSINI
jgi:hypothetical protein